MVGPLITAVVVILLVGWGLSAAASSAGPIVLAVLADVGIGLVVPKAMATYKVKMAVWHQSWICGRCSTLFIPGPAQPLPAAQAGGVEGAA